MIELGTNHALPGLPTAATKPAKRSTAPATPPPGRPSVMTPDVLQKLEDAFSNAFTDEMACLYAGISESTLYAYCAENKDFSERKERLKLTPHLAAQKELVDGIKGNLGQARWFAEHRMPDFIPKTKLEHSGKLEVGTPLQSDQARRVAEKYEKEMKAVIIEETKGKTP